MKIALGADHGGYSVKEIAKKHLLEQGHEVEDCGTYDTASCNYPVYAEKVANAVAGGTADMGILFCGTGAMMSPTSSNQGESIPGICHLVCLEGCV